ncbi:MAG: DUF998 domain-containing protein, partial [Eggerthellaceae bacterium]|nr:DUF998 domain-containing protein [Eggerthellaceae bacterium]
MIKKIAPWAGMIGPLAFVVSFSINGFLQPGYDPVKRYISELSIGQYGWIQMTSFVFLGLCLLLFTFGLKDAFPQGRASKAAPILMAIIAVCYILSGFFVTDPYSMFDNQTTLHGTLHGIFGAIVFSLSAAICFVFWRRFRVDGQWRGFAAFTLLVGVLMVVVIVLMKIWQLQTGLLNDAGGVV